MKNLIMLSLCLSLFSATSAFSANSSTAKAAVKNQQVLTLTIGEEGFVPAMIDAKPGLPTVLNITRTTDGTCAKKIIFPSKKSADGKPLTIEIPLNQMVSVDLGKLEKGELRFGCSMGMMIAGVINTK